MSIKHGGDLVTSILDGLSVVSGDWHCGPLDAERKKHKAHKVLSS